MVWGFYFACRGLFFNIKSGGGFMITAEQLQTHPIADLIPSMTDEEYRGLLEDIKVNGLIDPIYLFEGKILDGRHRYRACLELETQPRFEEYQGDSPVAFVISRNLKRRHLTESQRAALAVELLPYIEKEARERQVKAGKAGEKYGVLGGRGIKKGSSEYNERALQLQEQDTQELEDRNSGTDDESHTGGNGEKPLGGKFPPRGFGEGRSTEIAAKLVDSNSKYVKTAKKLSQQAPEVFEAVKEGKVNIMQAKKIAELPEELRKSIIETVNSSGGNGHKVERIIANFKSLNRPEGGQAITDFSCAIDEQKNMALKLYLACFSYDEIASVLGVKEETVTGWISDIQSADKVRIPDSLQVYNLWQFNDCSSGYGIDYPGRIPGQIVENLLYYYTKPFDIVVDPMAGGGTTIDVCIAMSRRYRAYDIQPVRQEIKQWDITQGFPDECRGCDFIFLDPPYWKQKQNEYSSHKTNLANLSLDEFYKSIEKILMDAHGVLKDGGCIALIIGPTQDRGVVYDHAFQIYKILEKVFTFINRIIVPYTTQQARPYHITSARDGRYMLKLYRDLMIFKKQ